MISLLAGLLPYLFALFIFVLLFVFSVIFHLLGQKAHFLRVAHQTSEATSARNWRVRRGQEGVQVPNGWLAARSVGGFSGRVGCLRVLLSTKDWNTGNMYQRHLWAVFGGLFG